MIKSNLQNIHCNTGHNFYINKQKFCCMVTENDLNKQRIYITGDMLLRWTKVIKDLTNIPVTSYAINLSKSLNITINYI